MIKVLFVCHGNICRSTMAEFLFKDLVKRNNKENKIHIASAGTSSEEIGNPPHHGTRKKLAEFGISTEGKYATQLKKHDYDTYDYFIGMDKHNIVNMKRLFSGDSQNKVKLMLQFAGEERDIADPWYTGNFDKTYEDVHAGGIALFEFLFQEKPK